MRDNEKGREELKAPRLKSFFNEKKVSIQCLVWGFYCQTPFTKYQKNRNKYYYNGGKLGRKPKSDKEVKSSRTSEQWCKLQKISQSCSISSALLYASLFFWFLICNYELNLDSPWLS